MSKTLALAIAIGATSIAAAAVAQTKGIAVTCATDAKGRALSVSWMATGGRPAAETVKDLLDKAAARLP